MTGVLLEPSAALYMARGTEGRTGPLGRGGRGHCQRHADVYLCPGDGGHDIRGEKPRSWNVLGAPRQGWGGRSLRKERGLKGQFFASRTQNIRAFSQVPRFFLRSAFPEKIEDNQPSVDFRWTRCNTHQTVPRTCLYQTCICCLSEIHIYLSIPYSSFTKSGNPALGFTFILQVRNAGTRRTEIRLGDFSWR